jgi:hypothetical protein
LDKADIFFIFIFIYRHLCTSSKGTGAIAVIYHVIFYILAGLVLLNLMVGVIIGSIFEAKAGMDGDKLEVTIVRASDLPKADLFGGSDPFVTVTHQDESRSTKVVKSCLNPVWNQKFE